MAGSEPAYIVLRGGLAVPTEPWILLLDLERNGFHVTRDGDALIVGPRDRLTDDLCRRITRWKAHLIALVEYAADDWPVQ